MPTNKERLINATKQTQKLGGDSYESVRSTGKQIEDAGRSAQRQMQDSLNRGYDELIVGGERLTDILGKANTNMVNEFHSLNNELGMTNTQIVKQMEAVNNDLGQYNTALISRINEGSRWVAGTTGSGIDHVVGVGGDSLDATSKALSSSASSIDKSARNTAGQVNRSIGIGKTKRGRKQDMKRRSSEPWERGKKAPRKGNPRYKPVRVRIKKGKNKGKLVTRYKRRK